jgi:hypothetical protein
MHPSQLHTISALLATCILVLNTPMHLYGQTSTTTAGGAGVMIAGELWDSYMLFNNMTRGPWYSESNNDVVHQIRVGNFDRQWSTPTHMWPGGWNYGAFWNKAMEISIWDPDSTFNPPTIGGTTNPSHTTTAGPHYAFLAFSNTKRGKTLPGANDPLRNYAIETRWTDATKRHHAIYEAACPTTAGVDVKLTVHQYTLNWNNFNDFIIVELKLTNTGVVDMNADGVPERSDHVIEGLCANMHAEDFCSYGLNQGGGRYSELFAQRGIGFHNGPDTTGSPWAMHIAFPAESQNGMRDMGLFVGHSRYMADVWSAWAWLGARSATGTDAPTRFGTHAVGLGTERGWYVSGNVSRGYDISNDPRDNFVSAMGEFFVDGGRSLDRTRFDLAANPNLFAPGSTPGDLRTFTLKPANTRTAPDGDLKATNTFTVNPYEPTWTRGYTTQNNFDGDGSNGIGPFRLAVGETITLTLATAGGYRLQGVANAIATARWVYANNPGNYDLPFDYPPVPEIRIDNTLTRSVRIRWDNRADTHPDLAGYKIYRVALSDRVDWLSTGTRGLDEYWRTTSPGPTPSGLFKPVNPAFQAQSFVAGVTGAAGPWGPYTLQAMIPKNQLAAYADNSTPGYAYAWEDRNADVGFTYWYYVAACTGTPITLPGYVSFSNGATTFSVETSNVNRNGASGLWAGTYPFASLNSAFPKTAEGLKQIGTGFVVGSAVASSTDLLSGKAKITVAPNPYKRRAQWDNTSLPNDHRIAFMNLPANARITILDVSGQVIDQLPFASAGPNDGMMYWDLFSKDGIEIANGLYIYIAEYDGGQQVGYFSVLR